jgi:hypothetical protein
MHKMTFLKTHLLRGKNHEMICQLANFNKILHLMFCLVICFQKIVGPI